MVEPALGHRDRRTLLRGVVHVYLAAALLLTGCPAPGEPAGGTSTGRPSPTDDVPSAPVTAAPADAGTPLRPAVTVDLVSHDGPAAAGLQVSGTPDGGALVLVGRPPQGPVTTLVRVSATGEPTGSVAVPGMASAWDLHVLPDGTAVVTGPLAGGGAIGYGLVDPAGGSARTVAAVPLDGATTSVAGRSAVSADGRTVWLTTSTLVDGVFGHLLTGHDVSTGGLVASRDLFPELRSTHVAHQEVDVVGLAGLPEGGVALALNTYPPEGGGLWSPTVLLYDRALEPLTGPVPLAPHGEPATATALAVAGGGDLVVLVGGATTTRLLALPSGGGHAEPQLELPGPGSPRDLVIDPRGRAVLPARTGARSIDLTTGSTVETDVGCRDGVTHRGLAEAGGGRAWLLGGCFEEGALPDLLWLLP